jgi:hypothetical protein
MPELSQPLGVLGKPQDPFSGRAWRRDFPHGDFELLYKSHAKSPSEIEMANTWLAEDGADYRITPLKKISVSSSTEEEKETRHTKETNQERTARRAKQKLRWLIKCIGADRLLTLTFRENVTDYSQAEKCLNAFLVRCRNEWGREFKFAVVPERQKRGAWHFHLAVRGYWNVNKIRAYWWRALGQKCVMVEGKPVMLNATQTPGNVDMTSPWSRGNVRRVWAVDRLASYLAKYVGKTLGTEDLGGAPSYRGTRGLHPSIQRYMVKALTFSDVVEVFLAAAACDQPFLFQSLDRSVLWCAGRSHVPPGPQ